MIIRINGAAHEVKEKANLDELIRSKGLICDRIVVEHNLRVVSKERWPEVILNENDTLEIVSFVGGG